MIKFHRLVQVFALLLSSGSLIGAIVWAEKKQTNRTCQGVELTIENDTEPKLVEKEALIKLLASNISWPITGMPLRLLSTRSIENIVESNKFVRSGVVYKTWKGILRIALFHRKPIARILYPNQVHQYVDEEGVLLPLSGRHTARVLLVEIENLLDVEKRLTESSYGKALLALLNYIDRSPFWRAQIAQLCIDTQGKIVMSTQVGKQYIELGLPEDIEKKLAKLTLFYKQVVPYKGWNTYKRVNLEFERQIVCE